jgi:hypothetical protein
MKKGQKDPESEFVNAEIQGTAPDIVYKGVPDMKYREPV